MVGFHLLGQWFSTLAAPWKHLRDKRKKKSTDAWHPRNSNLIGLGCGLASGFYKSSLSDSNVQPSLKIIVLWGASEEFQAGKLFKSVIVSFAFELL